MAGSDSENTGQPFFKSPKDWSKIKIRVLQKYLQPFCFKLGSVYPEIFLVDGFAGAGRYDNGEAGSPLVSAQWAEQMQNEKRRFKFRCINVEADEATFQQLSKNLSPFVDAGLAQVHIGLFADQLPAILTKLKDAPALFFIDPFGVSDIDQKALAPLRERKGKTEILLRLDTHYITRMLGQDKALLSDTASVRSAAQSILKRVSSIFGATETEWPDELNARWQALAEAVGDSRKAKYIAIVELYEQALKRSFDFVISLPIRESFSAQPAYYLTFCSRHEDALLLMSDFMFKEEEALFLSEASHTQPLFFDAATTDWKNDQDEIAKAATEFLLRRLTNVFVEASSSLAKATMDVAYPISAKQWRKTLMELDGKKIEIEKQNAQPHERWRVRLKH